jgi:hypothetical protein
MIADQTKTAIDQAEGAGHPHARQPVLTNSGVGRRGNETRLAVTGKASSDSAEKVDGVCPFHRGEPVSHGLKDLEMRLGTLPHFPCISANRHDIEAACQYVESTRPLGCLSEAALARPRQRPPDETGAQALGSSVGRRKVLIREAMRQVKLKDRPP